MAGRTDCYSAAAFPAVHPNLQSAHLRSHRHLDTLPASSPPHKVFPRTTQDLKENLLKNISLLLCIFEKAVVGSLKLFENSSELCLGMGGRAREQLGIKSWIRIIFVCSLPAAVLDWENKQVLLGTNRR